MKKKYKSPIIKNEKKHIFFKWCSLRFRARNKKKKALWEYPVTHDG